jgi:hypothetical protein
VASTSIADTNRIIDTIDTPFVPEFNESYPLTGEANEVKAILGGKAQRR